MYSTVENRKHEHHHGILHIQIIFSTKYQFKLKISIFWTLKSESHIEFYIFCIFHIKLTVLIFWTKFALKGYFQSKMEEVSITIEFCIFKLV